MKTIVKCFLFIIKNSIGDPKAKENVLFILSLLINILDSASNLEEIQNTLDSLDSTKILL